MNVKLIMLDAVVAMMFLTVRKPWNDIYLMGQSAHLIAIT